MTTFSFIYGSAEPKSLGFKRISCINEQGKQIGFLDFTVPNGDYCLRIQALVIERDYRRQGAGTALLDKVKELSRSKYNSAKIEADIDPSDSEKVKVADLVKFYRKAGFTVICTLEGYYEGRFKP